MTPKQAPKDYPQDPFTDEEQNFLQPSGYTPEKPPKPPRLSVPGWLWVMLGFVAGWVIGKALSSDYNFFTDTLGW